ncbi:N-acetylglucosaminyl-diphospho-decaprenol L-rhamnosyltransferase [Aurantimicrobium minutum]|uniref:glycosyltransferase family 2 protein n=1 Tax=Aurantimicrobium minutum TaxID=708131 RepID=UPI002475DF55|nr:glycosyltransferase family 2 protein [Aurantimicrobium minutum]MDH6533345.1 N-acetylglucosaminyl-diphospho-decaprenol L-rhamnosyltransferase [Aurantimicrobium minutum]
MNAKLIPPVDVAIITVSYNSSAQLESFLASAAATVAHSGHIFVADNASWDIATTRIACKKFGASLVELDCNLGYGGAINKVVEQLPVGIDFIFVCNPDSVISLETIGYLRDLLDSDPLIGAAGPKILNEDGSVYPSGRNIPSLRNGIGHAIFSNIWPSNPWTKRYHSKAYLQDTTVLVSWVSGSCMAFRTETFRALNGFDEGYFMYMEDVDMGYRLGKLGYRVLYVPEVSITHIGGESTKVVKKDMLKIHHDSAMRFIENKYNGILWAPVRGVIRIGLATRMWLTKH